MSRLDRQWVWFFHFGNASEVICPCCRSENKKIHRVGDDWERGHIIPAKEPHLGPDIYENVQPICKQCNIDDKQSKSTYHYMVSIKTMNQEDLEPAIQRIRDAEADRKNNPGIYRCVAHLVAKKSGGSRKNKAPRCKNKKLPWSNYCGVHRTMHATDREQIIVNFRMLIGEALRSGEFHRYQRATFLQLRGLLDEWNVNDSNNLTTGDTLKTKMAAEFVFPSADESKSATKIDVNNNNNISSVSNNNISIDGDISDNCCLGKDSTFFVSDETIDGNFLANSADKVNGIQEKLPIEEIINGFKIVTESDIKTYSISPGEKLSELVDIVAAPIIDKLARRFNYKLLRYFYTIDGEETSIDDNLKLMKTFNGTGIFPSISEDGVTFTVERFINKSTAIHRHRYVVLNGRIKNLITLVPKAEKAEYLKKRCSLPETYDKTTKSIPGFESCFEKYFSCIEDIHKLLRILSIKYGLWCDDIAISDFCIDTDGKVKIWDFGKFRIKNYPNLSPE